MRASLACATSAVRHLSSCTASATASSSGFTCPFWLSAASHVLTPRQRLAVAQHRAVERQHLVLLVDGLVARLLARRVAAPLAAALGPQHRFKLGSEPSQPAPTQNDEPARQPFALAARPPKSEAADLRKVREPRVRYRIRGRAAVAAWPHPRSRRRRAHAALARQRAARLCARLHAPTARRSRRAGVEPQTSIR
eukprot:2985055-Pleurochrysis_carterae.AAC.1